MSLPADIAEVVIGVDTHTAAVLLARRVRVSKPKPPTRKKPSGRSCARGARTCSR